MMIKSSLDLINFKGTNYLIKRDDLLGELNGNKARKLEYLLKNPPPKNTKIISFGSSQSNAMLAISIFAKMHDLRFLYVIRPLCGLLKANPSGNLSQALNNHTILHESKQDLSFCAKSLASKDDLFIPQGVACKLAKDGYKTLAKELSIQVRSFWQNNKSSLPNLQKSSFNANDFAVFLPSGTGTSAMYLSKYCEFEVITTPCVGGEEYLRKQMLEIEKDFDFSNLKIIKNVTHRSFASLDLKLFELNEALFEESKIRFDLLYDSVGWESLLAAKEQKMIIYVHQGGLEGNASMLQRYKRKYGV